MIGKSILRPEALSPAQFAEQAPPQQPGPQPPPPRLTGSLPASEDPKAAKDEIMTFVFVDSQVGQTCFKSRLA